MSHYTLVRHSAAATHPEFEHAVELVGISPSEARKVVAAGGVAFTDWSEADAAEYATNYPDDDDLGLVPTAAGRFVQVGVLEAYVPAPAIAPVVS